MKRVSRQYDAFVESVRNQRRDYTPQEVVDIIDEKRKYIALDVFEISFDKTIYTLEYTKQVADICGCNYNIREINEWYTVVFYDLDIIPETDDKYPNLCNTFHTIPVSWMPYGIFADGVMYHMSGTDPLFVQTEFNKYIVETKKIYQKNVTIKEGIQRHLVRHGLTF